MWRMIVGSLMVVGLTAEPAWSQHLALPKPADRSAGNWLIFGGVAFLFYILLMIYVIRRQKLQNLAVTRSLEMADERLRLARQQIALQEETNRLLTRLVGDQGEA